MLMSAAILGCLNSDNDKKEDHDAGGSSGCSQKSREMRTSEGVQGKTWTQKRELKLKCIHWNRQV
jgi:hypothetical protein